MDFLPARGLWVRHLAAVCLACLLTPWLHPQPAIALTEPPPPLLPPQFDTWKMRAPLATGTDPGQIDPVQSTPLHEDGLQRFAVGQYGHGVTGDPVLEVRVLQFIDATGASAAFSLYRGVEPELQPLSASQRLGAESAAGSDEVLFRTGNTIVLAKAPRLVAADLKSLAATLPKVSGPKGMSPLLPTLLPSKNLDPRSVRYSLGPASYSATGGFLPAEVLGFEKSAEEVTARYAARGGPGTLTILLYPTPQIAGDYGRLIQVWLNAHKEGLGTILLRREGPLILMTTGGFTPDDGQRLIENIHLRNEVTWDKKMPLEFHSEIQKTYSLLTSITVLSGVLMAAAVLLGLFLGFGRASVRVWMGKPAAVEAEFLGLGLDRGPSKPLQPSDDSQRR